MDKKLENKEAIIAEYLAGEVIFRQLAIKHGVDFRKFITESAVIWEKLNQQPRLQKKNLKPR